jgi:hypothetical protein
MENERFTFVAAVNDLDVLKRNLCLSPCVDTSSANQLIIKHNYRSASLAYNEALDESKNDIVIFVHQDVFLPETWQANLRASLSYFEKEKIQWGVLGCYGVRKNDGEGIGLGRVYTNGLGIVGQMINKPESVQTLDEIILVLRKSSGLRYDPLLPHFHLYGTDICMTAREKGLLSFAIPAFCIHNTNQLLQLPREFYECYRHVKKRWKMHLPIYTSCITISRLDAELRLRQFHEFCRRLICKATIPTYRVEDPRVICHSLKID